MLGGNIRHQIGIMLRWLLEPEVPSATGAPLWRTEAASKAGYEASE